MWPRLEWISDSLALQGTAGDPVATSTPRQRSGSGLAEELTVDDGLELSSGFENPHFDRVTGGVGTEEDGVVGGQGKVRVTSCEEGAEDSDDIGPVVDQVIFSTQNVSIHRIFINYFWSLHAQ